MAGYSAKHVVVIAVVVVATLFILKRTGLGAKVGV